MIFVLSGVPFLVMREVRPPCSFFRKMFSIRMFFPCCRIALQVGIPDDLVLRAPNLLAYLFDGTQRQTHVCHAVP